MTITSPEQASVTPETSKAESMAADLEALAAFVRANPDLGEQFAGTFQRFLVCLVWKENQRDLMADWVRRGLAAGARIEKEFNDKYTAVNLHFGPLELHVYASRDQVCERVVVGTREVVEEVQDPDALAAVPTITQTRTEDVVEWVCKPLLAGEQAAEVSA